MNSSVPGFAPNLVWDDVTRTLTVDIAIKANKTISAEVNADFGVDFDPLLSVTASNFTASMTGIMQANISFGARLLSDSERVGCRVLRLAISALLEFLTWRQFISLPGRRKSCSLSPT